MAEQGGGIMSEQQDSMQDLDDWIFQDEEYQPSQR